jgi:dTDP-4-dehydrorhamnose reductase
MNNNPYILVTGSNGQLGSELQALAQNNYLTGAQFLFTDAAQLDICDAEAVYAFFREYPIAWCINCAAYTAVDKAESDIDNAINVNVTGAQNLAKACDRFLAKYIHISTDYVYHNAQNTPYVETDETNPQSVYGLTKLQGEIKAMEACFNTLVIRTSWVYSSYGNNFVKTMLRLGAERSQLTVIFDQIGSPTYAGDLAKAILDMLLKIEANQVEDWRGIYHYSNEGVCSWYDFAKAIFSLANIDCQVSPIETKDYPTPAKRPHFSLLNKAKVKANFNLAIPHWQESLEKCLEKLKMSK